MRPTVKYPNSVHQSLLAEPGTALAKRYVVVENRVFPARQAIIPRANRSCCSLSPDFSKEAYSSSIWCSRSERISRRMTSAHSADTRRMRCKTGTALISTIPDSCVSRASLW
ncbi:hypothetical protein BO71DRAFT_163308 [Aspergillus ellipticus CBS 707.79]|uniref:Uncharacterized protein n=1 Tax=Aspergillus ellipticus CBS 707.79 TaxID=1448320 RepID=A0A319E7J0_9EURO|nr:hypothetical protein BO71DRAFT_163308 [Aspergillus ellipticus CBS 707.79]